MPEMQSNLRLVCREMLDKALPRCPKTHNLNCLTRLLRNFAEKIGRGTGTRVTQIGKDCAILENASNTLSV